MENVFNPLTTEKQNVSSTQPMFPTDSNLSPQLRPSAPPPPYSDRSQYAPPSRMPPSPAMGYPEHYVSLPAPGGQTYYPQPGVAYPRPPVPNYQAPQPQQQQLQQYQQQYQQVIVVNSNRVEPVRVVRPPPVSMVGAIVISCFVFWFCGLVCGGLAFILAMVGQSSAAAGDTRGAIQMRNASLYLSGTGIAIALIAIISVAVIYAPAAVSSYRYSGDDD